MKVVTFKEPMYGEQVVIVSAKRTLKGVLIELEAVKGCSTILALVDVNAMFGKVTLLQAFSLNYEYAKKIALLGLYACVFANIIEEM